ncbi:MAG: tetratricopeptide repeat protein [Candidatus Zixiibacteriota bacterium]|nr:MAG: tetratricopeptide repeat protein [candidate division Zixibacteria bacterium]
MRSYLAVMSAVILLASCGAKLPSDTDLFARAQEHEGRQEYNDALEKYDLIIENYPQSEIRYKAVFMKGLILLENLKDNKRAAETFDDLLAEYPDCDLADDAAVLREIAAGNGDIMSVFEDSLKQE